jgi:hypothetical protein
VFPLFLCGLPTFLMGLSFPILQRAVHDDVRTSGRKVGFLQAANIVGCMSGSLLVGLVLLTRRGTTGTMRWLLAGGVVFAAIGVVRSSPRRLFAAAAGLLMVLFALLPEQRDFWLRLHGTHARTALVEEDATGVAAITPFKVQRWTVWVNGTFRGTRTGTGMPTVSRPRPSSRISWRVAFWLASQVDGRSARVSRGADVRATMIGRAKSRGRQLPQFPPPVAPAGVPAG